MAIAGNGESRARRMIGVSLALGALFAQGCRAERSPGIPPATSINAMMVGAVDHAAHHIWDLGREGMAPESDQDWDEVWHASVQLIAAATAITTGGTTGPLDEGWVQDAEWRAWAQAMMDAAVLAYDAALERDLAASGLEPAEQAER